MSQPETAAPDRRLFGLCLFTLGWTVLVLQAGGFTTSIRAGMAFLDWPLSNGSVNPPGWLTEIDKFAEHSHRLAATGLGLLCVAIAIAHGLRENRRAVRVAAYALVGLVVFQGLLGGLRVLLDRLNVGGESNLKAAAFAVGHAVNAQLTLALLAFIALAHTVAWHQARRSAPRSLARAGVVAAGLTLAPLTFSRSRSSLGFLMLTLLTTSSVVSRRTSSLLCFFTNGGQFRICWRSIRLLARGRAARLCRLRSTRCAGRWAVTRTRASKFASCCETSQGSTRSSCTHSCWT